jgi:tetratricopeptide (TPR) repeat protein
MVNPQQQPSPGTEDALVAEAERLLRQGEPLLAYNVAETGLQRWPDHLRLRQLLALSLTRSGDSEKANRVLTELTLAGVEDAETLGLLAATHKDLGLRGQDVPGRGAHLDAAKRLYEQAYAAALQRGSAADAYYTGINAATLAVLRGQLDEARWLAAEVNRICHEAAGGDPQAATDFWRQATLGEAALILGDAPAAAQHYANAAAIAHNRYGDLSTTRRQARLLAAHLPIDDAWLGEILCIPPVLVFTGNMVDQASRATPRFPASLTPVVERTIEQAIGAVRPLAAYGSAACGADILCLERAQALGSEIHVVLPYPPEEFRRTSVDVAPGDWGPRFDRLLAAAHSVTVTSDHLATGSMATFEYANLVMTGLSKLRAQLLDTTLRGLAVWDRSGGGAPGGAASVVSMWQGCGVVIDHVNLGFLRQEIHSPTRSLAQADAEIATDASTSAHLAADAMGGARHAIKALLFADAVGYSQLSEDQIPRYVNGFLGAVADLNRRTRHRFEHVETAGDGLYMVFADAVDAAHYALQLSAVATGTDWTVHGLPSNFNLRIALHCGPVYCGRDPITEGPLFTGPHTSRAARIEPITPPGQVYASSAFAAVAAVRGADGVTMRYIGKTPLAKRSGSLSLYHLRPAQ